MSNIDAVSKSILRHAPRGSLDPLGDYARLANELASRIALTLQPKAGEAILDVGCGNGRVAGGLANILPPFRYLGFDIRLTDIMSAKTEITSNNPDIQFVHFDFYNERYNGKGRIKDIDHYAFPAPSKSFEFAIATSFFTHTNSEMTQKCLLELKRILKPGGKAFLTFFVFGKNKAQSVHSNRNYVLEFEPEVWAADPDNLLQAVAYEERKLLELLKGADLEIEKFVQGEWRGSETESFSSDLKHDPASEIRSSQDILIVRA